MNLKWRNWLDNTLKKVLEGAPLTNVNVYCTIEFALVESNFGRQERCRLRCEIGDATGDTLIDKYEEMGLPCNEARSMMSELRKAIEEVLMDSGYTLTLRQTWDNAFNDNYHYKGKNLP